MDNNNNQYTLQQLTAYLMIYAAYADFSVSDQEAQLIVTKIGEQNYQEITFLYKSHTDYESANFIQEQCAIHITSKKAKEEILQEMRMIILADDKIDFLEEAILKAVSRLIEQ